MKVSGHSLFRSGIRFPMSCVFPLCDSRSRELRTFILEKATTASGFTKILKSFTIGCWSLGGKKVGAWKISYWLWQQDMITASTRNPNLPNNHPFRRSLAVSSQAAQCAHFPLSIATDETNQGP